MMLSALITDFLQYLELEKNASQKTIQNYDHCLKRFLNFVHSTHSTGSTSSLQADSGQASDITPAKIDLDLIRKYRLYLSRWVDPKTEKPLKRITQNYFMIALRVFLRYLAQRDILTLSAEKVALCNPDPRPLKILDQDNKDRLLRAPDTSKKMGIRDKSLLEILFSTGLMVSELASLNRDTIKAERRKFWVIGKGGKIRLVLLSDAAYEWLQRYLMLRHDSFKPLFIRFQGRIDTDDHGERMRLTPRSIQRIVEKYAKKANLPLKVTPHTLRHSFATDSLINGADIKSVQEMLGHSSITTTQIYTHVISQHLKE